MVNTGKKFEQLIKQSAEEQGIEYTRFRDAGFMRAEKSEHKRFTPKNICDCLLFNGKNLYYIEAKAGKTSVAFSRLTQHESLLKKHQGTMPSVRAGYFFDIKGRCFYADAADVGEFMATSGKKSLNDKDLEAMARPIPRVVPPGKRTPRLDLSALP